MSSDYEGRARALRWLTALVGPRSVVEQAKRLDVSELARKGRGCDPAFVHQIEADVPRSGIREEVGRNDLRDVLLAWLSLNPAIGYTQGFNCVAALLLRTFRIGGVAGPRQMSLAAMGSVIRINVGLVPLSVEDATPMTRAYDVAKQILAEVRSSAPSLRLLGKGSDVLTILVMRVFPVLFVDFWAESALPIALDYILEDFSTAHLTSCVIASRRCRHLLSAALLLHRKLFVLNAADVRQSFVIFESCCGIAAAQHVSEIVELARHLERIESIAGGVV